MKKTILIIIFLAVIVGGAYYIGTRTTEVEYIETIVDLTKSDTLRIQQQARLNWIPLDSASWNLGITEINWVNKTRWEDSTRWSFKDSIIVKDSTRVVYVPVYIADDTLVNFDEKIEDVRVQLSLAIKPRFFPIQERFLTDVQMRELILTQPERTKSWFSDRWVIYLGWGLTYYKRTEDTFSIVSGEYYERVETSTKTFWTWSNGFQLGIGFRLY